MKSSRIALGSWFHPTLTVTYPLSSKAMQKEDLICLLTFTQCRGVKITRTVAKLYLSSVVLGSCRNMPFLLLLSIIISCLWVTQSNTWMQLIYITNLLHHDPNSELISFTDFASSAEPPTEVWRAKGNIWHCWWTEQFARGLLRARAALTTHHTFCEQNFIPDEGTLYIIPNAKHYATSWLNDEVP